MAKRLYTGRYRFDASQRQVVLEGNHIKPDQLLAITNVLDGEIIYNFADPTKGYTVFQNNNDIVSGEEFTVINLEYNTTSMSDSDPLQIFTDELYVEIQPAEDLLDPVGKMRVSNPGNLIDTDFEYGLQSTKWESLQTVNNIPTIYSSTGDVPVEGLVDITVETGSKSVQVETQIPHTLAIGDPISVAGVDLYSAEGYFIVTGVASPQHFTFDMDVDSPQTGSIYGSYSTIVPSKFFEGSTLNVNVADGALTNGAAPSTITVTTDEAHGFQPNTKVYIRNTAGAKTFIISDSDSQAPDGRPYVDTVEDFSFAQTLTRTDSTGRGGNIDKRIFTYDWEATYTKYLAESDVDSTLNQINWPSHGLQNNYCLLFNTPIQGDTDAGLFDGRVYYAVVVDVNTIELSTTQVTLGATTGNVSLQNLQNNFGQARLGLVYKVEQANQNARLTAYANAGGGGAGTIQQTNSSLATTSGDGSSGDPFIAFNTNNFQDSTTAFAEYEVSGGSGSINYQIDTNHGGRERTRLRINGNIIEESRGSDFITGTALVSSGDIIRWEYEKDGAGSVAPDTSDFQLIFIATSTGNSGLGVELSGSDLVANEFGLGVSEPDGLVAFQGFDPTAPLFNQDDTISALPNQQFNGRYGTFSHPYPNLSVTSGDNAGTFFVSQSNNTFDFGTGSEIFYIFIRNLASLKNTFYLEDHGLQDGTIVTATITSNNYNGGERFRYASDSGFTTIATQVVQFTASVVSDDVFRLQVNEDPNTDDIVEYPGSFSLSYGKLNETFNTIYLERHKITGSVDATYNVGVGGTAIGGFTDGGTYTLTRVNDDRVRFAVQGSPFEAIDPANTAPIGSNSNAVQNFFVDVGGVFGTGVQPSSLIINEIYFHGDFGSSTEYVDITFDDGDFYRIGANDDIGDSWTWKDATNFADKAATSLIVENNGAYGFNLQVDPSVQVNFFVTNATRWWELKFTVSGTTGVSLSGPGNGQQIFNLESTIGAFDGIYEVLSTPTSNTFTLQGEFQIPQASFDFVGNGGAVDTNNDTIDFGVNHNLITGEKITYNNNGNFSILPNGVSDTFAIVVDRQVIKIAGSYIDAINGDGVQLATESGTHTISSSNIIKGVKGSGTVNTVTGSNIVTGIGSNFLTNFKKFDTIWITVGGYAAPFTVESVTSPNNLTLFETVPGTVTGSNYYYSTQLSLRPDGYNLHKPFDGGVDITAGTSPYSKIVRQSRKYFRYQSGKGIQNSFAINFNPPKIVRELIRASGTTATVSTQEAHNLSIGDRVIVEGAEVDQGTNTYNGIFPVASVPDDFTFTYTMSSTPTDTRAGGFPTYVRESWTDSFVRAGMFDDQNGFFYEYDGQKLYCVRRSSTLQVSGNVNTTRGSQVVTGSGTSFTSQLFAGDYVVIRGQSYLVVRVNSDTNMIVQPPYRGADAINVKATKTIDTRVPQDEWNIDKADGTGPFGFNLDLRKIQMAYADYSWYGAGKIRFGFKDQKGHIRYMHEFKHNNKLNESYFRSGNLPARYEIANGPAPTTAPTLFHFGTSIIMDGRFDDDKAYQFIGQSKQFSFTDSDVQGFSTTDDSTFDQITLNAQRVYVYKFQVSESVGQQLSVGMKIEDSSGTISQDTYVTQLKDLGTGAYEVYTAYPALTTDPTGTGIYGTIPATTNINFGDRKALDDYIPLISARLAPSVDSGLTGNLGEREIINRMQLALKQASVTTDRAVEVFIILNALPSRLDYVKAPSPSLSQLIRHDAGDSLLNATVIYSTKASAGSINVALQELLEVGNSILGGEGVFPSGPDLVTLAVQPQDTTDVSFANPFRISGQLSWSESQA